MQSFNFLNIFIVLIWFISLNGAFSNIGDPYKILGINNKATLKEIRRSYKQLAKEWHPDKSNHPDAENKFVEIKKAYELLADADRRKAYDLHGITNEDADINRQRYDYTQYGRFASDNFEEFFGNHFHFNQDISLFHKLSITTRYYETNVVPKSYYTPYILMFYADWCFTCMKATGSFKKIIDTLEPLGVIFATVNAGHEKQLARKASVHTIPCIVLVLDGRNFVFKDSVFSVQKVVDFLRLKFPYRLMTSVNDAKIDEFLNGWRDDNRVRALILEPRIQPRLRYIISAYHYRHHISFGFVQLNSKDSIELQQNYKIHPNLDSLLIFNEDNNRPVASVMMSDIPTSTLNNILSSNRYLALPRLSSQEMLEGLCPVEWNRPRKRLCVVLVTENTDSHSHARDIVRRIALDSGFSGEKVRFAYIYQEKQTEFINALSNDIDDTLLRLVIIWRRDTSHIQYEWINDISLHIDNTNETANLDHHYNITKTKMDNTIHRLLKATEIFSSEAEVKDLLDEHAHGMIAQIFNKIILSFEYLSENFGQDFVLPAVSVIATIAFIVSVGYLMAYLVRVEEESIQKQKANEVNQGKKTSGVYVPELKLYELRAEKFNTLIRCLKPGCRTILLITDLQSRPNLIPGFHKAVWPYRKNKSLMFAHMLIERGQKWYTELLNISLVNGTRDLQINPKNCIGTVLALNGHRKYFCMFHAKHPETKKGEKRLAKMTKHFSSTPKDLETGAFIGMNSSDSEESEETNSTDSKILLQENLLNGLSNWLDRLFEGTTHRYHINYWPDFTAK